MRWAALCSLDAVSLATIMQETVLQMQNFCLLPELFSAILLLGFGYPYTEEHTQPALCHPPAGSQGEDAAQQVMFRAHFPPTSSEKHIKVLQLLLSWGGRKK